MLCRREILTTDCGGGGMGRYDLIDKLLNGPWYGGNLPWWWKRRNQWLTVISASLSTPLVSVVATHAQYTYTGTWEVGPDLDFGVRFWNLQAPFDEFNDDWTYLKLIPPIPINSGRCVMVEVVLILVLAKNDNGWFLIRTPNLYLKWKKLLVLMVGNFGLVFVVCFKMWYRQWDDFQ